MPAARTLQRRRHAEPGCAAGTGREGPAADRTYEMRLTPRGRRGFGRVPGTGGAVVALGVGGEQPWR